MADTPTFRKIPDPKHPSHFIIQRDGVDWRDWLASEYADSIICIETLLAERALTEAEELLGCSMKVYSHERLVTENGQHWFYCERHSANAPCPEARVVETLLAREARVRAVLPELSHLGRGLVEHALDGAS